MVLPSVFLIHSSTLHHRLQNFTLSYCFGTAAFTAGSTLTGTTSHATATIVSTGNLVFGTLTLHTVSGTFIDGEPLTDNGAIPGAAVAGCWNHGTITIAAPAAVANSQHYVDLVWTAGMCSDFSDIQIVQNDGTILSYWIQPDSVVAGVSARIYYKVVATGQASVYLFWNGVAASRSDIDNTFVFGDDFPGATINASKWPTTAGSLVCSGSVLTVLRAGGVDALAMSGNMPADPITVIARLKSKHFQNNTYAERFSYKYAASAVTLQAAFCYPGVSIGKLYRNLNTTETNSAILGWVEDTWAVITGKATGTSAIWQVNGTNTVTITTNYPNGAGKIRIIAGSADNSEIDIDWVVTCINDPITSTLGSVVPAVNGTIAEAFDSNGEITYTDVTSTVACRFVTPKQSIRTNNGALPYISTTPRVLFPAGTVVANHDTITSTETGFNETFQVNTVYQVYEAAQKVVSHISCDLGGVV
jgi:hypothetical protein